RPDALVLDVRQGVTSSWIKSHRSSGAVVATIDDPSDYRLHADLAFYPPIAQVAEFDWRGFTGVRLVGPEWVVLRRAFADPPPPRPHREHATVLVTMGGSDPAGMTLTALEAVAR